MNDTIDMTQKQKEKDLIQISKTIAYQGSLGRKREKFCVQSIEDKKELRKYIDNKIKEKVRAENKVITCQKACIYASCCMEYIDVTVRECEEIVYYLYNNENELKLFIKNFQKWREKANKINNILIPLEKFSFESTQIYDKRPMEQLMFNYYYQKINCPFLNNNLCYIYDVRPYSCSSYYVTTPLSQCHPDYTDYVPVMKPLPQTEFINTGFYYNELKNPVLLCMQKAVYGILERGYYYLSMIPGLEGIENEAISDKKIRNKYKKYINSKQKFGDK